ncbi:MAG: hypothetical protein AAF657_00405 [Acidobacteriota bacterium]
MLPTDQTTTARVGSLSPFHRIKLLFLGAAFASLVLSVTLWFSGARDEGLFVGIWVPAIHSLGALVLTGERSRFERGERA